MKILPVGADFSHEDRRTDVHDEANSSFSKFCERAQKYFRQKVLKEIETFYVQ
jgi:hypothetical protein